MHEIRLERIYLALIPERSDWELGFRKVKGRMTFGIPEERQTKFPLPEGGENGLNQRSPKVEEFIEKFSGGSAAGELVDSNGGGEQGVRSA
jgi:hypothetical protein